MKVVNRVLLFVSCLIFLMSLSLLPLSDAVAKEKGGGAGVSPGPSERPPGWDEGEKKGWDSNVPPGLEGKEEGRGQKGKREGGSEGEKKGKLEGVPSTSVPDEKGGKKEGKLEKGEKGKEGQEGKKDKKQGGKGKPKKQKG
ncbi:MAG: hypothetical protein A3E19_02625 [Planctomycetes bacterium RIFCSPHIGHO2_12_FULL_52_36]|nr:MAG: hypothetical protein A3D89_05165 [Planctomycetes bacterium RIFCSPHIGHO2_02_FULL_52_58]OHB94480.1 MAG: hypothetical protein A3E19_02625 [Planctomycetes bacterium RIFCSPHIGHO2_12_FULL_52_36]